MEIASDATGVDHAHETDEVQTRSKWARVISYTEVDTDVCFESYDADVKEANGSEWIECSCGRWLHEDYSFSVPAMPMSFNCPYTAKKEL